VASVSAVRPHTARPLAWIPADAEPGLGGLLDRLGIVERVTQDRFPGLALLDATDVDSVELGHREQVESLLPRIDAVIWVLDPDKYADPTLHDEFIRPLADSADQFLFVLNQVDRLAPTDRLQVADDLLRRLDEDGISDPIVFYTAADPAAGPRRGVDDLAAYLERRLDAKRVQLSAMLSDARRTARDLVASAGLAGGSSLAFEERWAELVAEAAMTLSLTGDDRAAVEEVLCTLEEFVGQLAAEAGGPFGVRIRARFTPDTIEQAVLRAVEEMDARVPRLPGGAIRPEDRSHAAGVLADRLQIHFGAPLRKVLWERAALAASVAGLAVDTAQAEARLRA
jgi:hypothetical protein